MGITEENLLQARTAWGDGLIAIAKAYEAEGIEGAREVAAAVLDSAYGYDLGPVLFKPTMASGAQTFRPTRKGALSYFVGHDDEFPLDGGFGLKGWRHVTSESSAHFIEGDVALWMGRVDMTDKDGQLTSVDKSFGYKLDAQGVLKIILHHSSLPYQPQLSNPNNRSDHE
jgi:hypothetical protein